MSIYEPLLMSPKNETRDMTQLQVFSANVQGSQITDYQLKIYNNDTNILLYDSTKQHLSVPLYNDDTLLHTVPANTITTVRNLKWILQVWNGTNTVTSRENFFNNYEVGTLTMSIPSIINTQNYLFTGLYTQAQSLSVSSFKFILYDINNNILEETDIIYSGSIKHTFEGFADGNSYKIKCIITNEKNVVVTSNYYTFAVDYIQPSVLLKPRISNLEDQGAIQIVWDDKASNIGNYTGNIDYITNFGVVSNNALHISNDSTLYYNNVLINEVFTEMFLWQTPTNNFEGKITKLENVDSGNYYEVGYIDGRFYYDINGLKNYTIPIAISTSFIFLIALLPTKIIVRKM